MCIVGIQEYRRNKHRRSSACIHTRFRYHAVLSKASSFGYLRREGGLDIRTHPLEHTTYLASIESQDNLDSALILKAIHLQYFVVL